MLFCIELEDFFVVPCQLVTDDVESAVQAVDQPLIAFRLVDDCQDHNTAHFVESPLCEINNCRRCSVLPKDAPNMLTFKCTRQYILMCCFSGWSTNLSTQAIEPTAKHGKKTKKESLSNITMSLSQWVNKLKVFFRHCLSEACPFGCGFTR